MNKNTTTNNAADAMQSAVSWADLTPAQRSHSGSGEGWCLVASIVGIFALLAVFVALVISAIN
jgi:hypothetical protein